MSKERAKKEVFYPESDGKPMADNTLQFRWIVTIKEGLDLQLKDDFVAGDLFWYPVEGNPFTKVAPDVMVALGRPKGERRSYKQWEENDVAPQVVFETISYTNSRLEMEEKLRFYDYFDVQEYYLYDPEQFVYKVGLRGWTRREGKLIETLPMNGWVSPLLGIRFEFSNQELKIFHPDGSRFLSFAELEVERLTQKNRAEQAENRAEQAENRAEQLAKKLRALGIDPSSI
ncbi:MAG: Uma2 family endonuclease [Acidobacteria bacterium]|nr:Uma2 family endonuclease [Acidobacteriota bacterium]